MQQPYEGDVGGLLTEFLAERLVGLDPLAPAAPGSAPAIRGNVSPGLVRVTQVVLARSPSNSAIPACRACRSASPVETPRKLTR